MRRLGAVQSQDFAPGKWSIAQRTFNTTNSALDELFASGTILRTHVLRPTWHFVLPEDICWLLELTAPRVQIQSASFFRTQELDSAVSGRCHAVLEAALRGAHYRTRAEIGVLLAEAGIAINPLRLGAMLMNAELHGLICSGAPRGKQQTYALLAERAPQAWRLDREEAVAKLMLRYFTGHGPATAKDLKWWSSLTVADIRHGLELVGSQLDRETIDGETYWFAGSALSSDTLTPAVQLVQGYDEYIVGYAESKYLIDVSEVARSLPRSRGIYTHSILLDGQVTGEWKPVATTRSVNVHATLFTPFGPEQMEALHRAIERYGEFMELPVRLAVAQR